MVGLPPFSDGGVATFGLPFQIRWINSISLNTPRPAFRFVMENLIPNVVGAIFIQLLKMCVDFL